MSSKALSFLNFILTCAGFSYLHRDKEKFHNLKSMWQIANIIPTLLLIFGGIYFMNNNKKILAEFAESITINAICYLMIVEEICLFIYRDDIKEMVDCFILNDYEMRLPFVAYIKKTGVMGPKTAQLLTLMNSTRAGVLRIFTIFMILMSAACFGCGVLFCSSPIVLETIQPDSYYRKLPLNIQFPWDEKKSLNYQMTFILHIYFNAYIPCIYVGIDCLIALVVGQIIRQVMIVRFIMSNLEGLADETSGRSGQQWEIDCDVMLANCVAHYVHLKRNCKRLNLILKPYLLAMAFVSGFVLCFAMFIIATAEELLIPRNVILLLLGCATVFHLGLFCALGQHLINESEKLRQKVVGSWWLHGKRYRSSIRIFQMVLLRPITLYIFGSIDLSYATYLSLLKSSMSYFTILLTVTQK